MGWAWADSIAVTRNLSLERPTGSCCAGRWCLSLSGQEVCTEKYIKVHLGAKQAGDKQLFSFQDCIEAAKVSFFLSLFSHLFCLVSCFFFLCVLPRSFLPIFIITTVIINWLAFPQVLPQLLRKRFTLTNRLPVLTQTCSMIWLSCCWESHTQISGLVSFSKLKHTTSGSNLGNGLAFYKKPDINYIYSLKSIQFNLVEWTEYKKLDFFFTMSIVYLILMTNYHIKICETKIIQSCNLKLC